MSTPLPTPTHPIWRTVAGLLVGYGIVLAIVFVVFYILPYVLFLAN